MAEWMNKHPALTELLSVFAMIGLGMLMAPPVFYVMGIWWKFWIP